MVIVNSERMTCPENHRGERITKANCCGHWLNWMYSIQKWIAFSYQTIKIILLY